MSGVCLSQLESPPTISPTSAGGLDVYYPDYDTAWDKAACVNTRPMPSGRPIFSTMIACCKGAYGGQMSGYCLSQAVPTLSPTLKPTLSPQPTLPPPFPFTTNSELRTAIKDYLSQNCTNVSTCQARTDYGGAVSRVCCTSTV